MARGRPARVVGLEPGRWWELRGPVAVWTPAGIWPSWEASGAHRSEPWLVEVGERVARALGWDPPDALVGTSVYSLRRARPPRLGQLGLDLEG